MLHVQSGNKHKIQYCKQIPALTLLAYFQVSEHKQSTYIELIYITCQLKVDINLHPQGKQLV